MSLAAPATPQASRRRRGRAIAIYAAAAALAAGLGLAADHLSLRGFQLGLGFALVGVALILDNDAGIIPRVLRPAPMLFGSLVIGSISTSALTGSEYNSYFAMWMCEVLGFVVGIIVLPQLGRRRAKASRVNLDRLDWWTLRAWYLFALCALEFFATKGVPLLDPNIEQARVDVAASGTGYIRLLALMLGPAAILLFAIRGRRSWPYLLATAMLIAAFGNRVPLVYLAFPVIAMIAIVGQRIKSVHIVSVGALLVLLVGAIGTYRIISQKEFSKYAEYRQNLAAHNYLAVGVTSVTHYAATVPANAILVKHLIDNGQIPLQWGQTYVTLALSAAPGQQLSPDLLIKKASNKKFVGGGTPPTLAGEGYMNFGWLGIVVEAAATMLLLRWAGTNVLRTARDAAQSRIDAVIYGYVATWGVIAQVAGLAGAATTALAGFLVLLVLRQLAREPRVV